MREKYYEPDPFRMNDRRIKVCNDLRSSLGISLIKQKERNCLRCSSSFVSESNGHRMCSNCRGMTDDLDPVSIVFR